MIDDKNKKNHSDELYTITLFDQVETGEKIPERIGHTEKIRIYENPNKIETKAKEIPDSFALSSRYQKKQDFYANHGHPPVLTTSQLIAKQAYNKPPMLLNSNRKSFIEQAREYVDKTHEKTEHIPFMCYWPSYEYMSQSQLNWYFYMRSCIRNSEYIETDLSYLFVYIYELINQVGVNSPEDGLERLINVWTNYRNRYNKLDKYLTDWVGDYISYYKCDASFAFELLKKEGLFLLMPTDMLADYYFKNNLELPVELIARFSDYKLYESDFIKGENGSLFLDNLTSLINDIRCRMNKDKEGSFEKRELLHKKAQQLKKVPFQRAVFHNPENNRIDTYLPYEECKPFRAFITAVIKEFENQLRKLTNYKGRLRPDRLPDEIKDLCKKYAKNAFERSQKEQKVEITIDRQKLLELIQDSDAVRKRLIEGNYEYGFEIQADDSYEKDSSYERSQMPVPEPKDNAGAIAVLENNDELPKTNLAEAEYERNDTKFTEKIESEKLSSPEPDTNYTNVFASDKHREFFNNYMPESNIHLKVTAPVSNTACDSTESAGSFKSKLSPLQQKILDFLLSKGSSSTSNELSTAFPGVFVGVEIDNINALALDIIGDLLITFEDERVFIIEDYINEI